MTPPLLTQQQYTLIDTLLADNCIKGVDAPTYRKKFRIYQHYQNNYNALPNFLVQYLICFLLPLEALTIIIVYLLPDSLLAAPLFNKLIPFTPENSITNGIIFFITLAFLLTITLYETTLNHLKWITHFALHTWQQRWTLYRNKIATLLLLLIMTTHPLNFFTAGMTSNLGINNIEHQPHGYLYLTASYSIYYAFFTLAMAWLPHCLIDSKMQQIINNIKKYPTPTHITIY